MITLKWYHDVITVLYEIFVASVAGPNPYDWSSLDNRIHTLNELAQKFVATKKDMYRRQYNMTGFYYNEEKPWWYPKARSLSSMSRKHNQPTDRSISVNTYG